MKGVEFEIQKMVVNYISTNWPNIQHRSDLGGIYTGKGWGLAKKIKQIQKSRAWPDLLIAYPNKYYSGLFIEIKSDLGDLLTVKGEWRKGKSYSHIHEQKELIIQLRLIGYCAEFGCGFESCKSLIDWYMDLPKIYLGRVELWSDSILG